MKKRKTTIAVLIILAILILGIGYAVMSTTLQVSGSAEAEVDDANFKVVFTNATYQDLSYASSNITPTVEATVDASDATKATLSVSGFTAADDTVTFVYTIENQSEGLNATLATPSVTTNTNSTDFTVTTALTGATELAPNETSTMTVTVTCKTTPTASTLSTDIVVELEASLAS